jgi:hypothetical protein
VAGSCEYGDEPLGSGATELVMSSLTNMAPSLTTAYRHVFTVVSLFVLKPVFQFEL